MRNNRASTVLVGAVIGAMLLVCSAQADRRAYVWTYEYMTMPQGAAELEYYLTLKVPDWDDFDDQNTWEHQLELEYGLTDHWDVAVYQRWQHTNTDADDKFEYTGTKLRTRYRFAEKDVYPVDVLAYLEYKRPDGSNPDDEIEAKLILAKDIGKFNVAYNQIVEHSLRHGGKAEHEFTSGVSYEFDPTLKVGLESTGNYSEDKFYVGPTLSLAGKRFWLAAGALGGLNDRSDDLRARLIFGIPF
ncbi:MAG: hypothetical protein JSW27_13685 [Phycisphaerales bacterium]|nr:MAG: hypothetical protein JSW27_13685 [Phycisphaerales bacterium]